MNVNFFKKNIKNKEKPGMKKNHTGSIQPTDRYPLVFFFIHTI